MKTLLPFVRSVDFVLNQNIIPIAPTNKKQHSVRISKGVKNCTILKKRDTKQIPKKVVKLKLLRSCNLKSLLAKKPTPKKATENSKTENTKKIIHQPHFFTEYNYKLLN